MRRAKMLMYFGLILLLAPSCQMDKEESITLPLNCVDGQVIKWNEGTQTWECADDNITTGYITITQGCAANDYTTKKGQWVTWHNDSGEDVVLDFGLRHPFGLDCDDPCEIPIEKDGWEDKRAIFADRYQYFINGCGPSPLGPAWVIINQYVSP